MNDLVKIKTTLKELANPENQPSMEAYMKNQFPFLGIKAGPRKEFVRQYIRENGVPKNIDLLAENLFLEPEREYHYVAIDLLTRDMKKVEPHMIYVYEKLIQTKSWWDTVDAIAGTLVGNYFLKYPEEMKGLNEKWISGENIWLARTAILFQLKYKEKTDEALLFQNCDKWLHSKEFFIQKAIGWALREYAKTDALKVRAYVLDSELAPLSRREALKHIG
ncbi:DNA alkylation repair protein [Listeria fleischmannii 1991]|uniref:DNA alkylation repair enzyme n=2 Tax=Listeria fleischmannii TaxID=1069827 RepID=A0A2X3HCY5_9LIST|nr:DNA alkylation repair protein [Listeria fleischmannii]EMG27247.1 DNA alkylation repair enzyme [Listeria fleischmannii subsp. fleischmannii LU2006-1]KMT58380.1 DNA alkylation repair protein [Listeria fleischmannii 1991]SQC68515.1 DNA alkylation repair enzyme [Listeria fleischmannii subsp. fleischmannii]